MQSLTALPSYSSPVGIKAVKTQPGFSLLGFESKLSIVILGSQSKAFSTSACISVFTQKLKQTILLPNLVSQREIRLDAGILSILIILSLLFFLPQISLSGGIFASVSELMFLGIDDRNSSLLIFLTLIFNFF